MLKWTERVDLRGLWWPQGTNAGVSGTGGQPTTTIVGDTHAASDAPVTRPQREGEGAQVDEAAPQGRTVPCLHGSLWPAYGTASFDPADGIELDVLGPTGDPFALTEQIMTVFGSTITGEEISLLGSLTRQSSGTLWGLGRHRLTAQLLVRGMHLVTLKEFRFCRARIRLQGLRDFLWDSQHGAVGLDAREGEHFERVVALSGAKLTFSLGWDCLSGRHRHERERVGTAELELDEPLDFEEWIASWVDPLQHLVVFATREPSRIEAFTAITEVEAASPWWKPEQPAGQEERQIDFISRQNPLLADEQFGYRRVLFHLDELGEAADAVLREWFALDRRLHPSAGLLFSTLTSQMFIDQRLVGLSSAAEGYHRAKHPTPRTVKLRNRLCSMFATAGTVLPILADDIQRRAQQLVDSRDYIIHQEKFGEHVLVGFELHDALDRLVVVLQANLLLDLGVPPDWCGQALRRSYEGQRVIAGG